MIAYSLTPNGSTIHRLRSETPGCRKIIHLNNAGCSLPPQKVIQTTQKYYEDEVIYGGYETVYKSQNILRRPYTSLGQLLNCSSEEIAIVSSATSAWQQVLFGINFKLGDVILTTPNEYGSNYINLLQLQRRHGIRIMIIPETSQGDLDLEEMENLIKKWNPSLVSITHVPTSLGNVYDAIGVGQIAQEYGIPYLLDACQSVGQLPLDVESIGCDFLSGTSRKFLRGPRGIGFLYIAKEKLKSFEPALLDVQSAVWNQMEEYQMKKDAGRFEQYEINFAAKAGFGAAVGYCLELSIDWITKRVSHLADYFREQLKTIPDITIHDHCSSLCGIVGFTKKSMPSEEVVAELSRHQINAHVSKAASTRIKLAKKDVFSPVRVSVHYYNTIEELDKCLDVLH